MSSVLERERSISKNKRKGISVSLTPSKTPNQNEKESSLIMSSVSIIEDENHINTSQMHNFNHRKSSLNSSPAVRFIYQSPSLNDSNEFEQKKCSQYIYGNDKKKSENKSQKKTINEIKYKNQHDIQTLILIKDQFNLSPDKIQNIRPKAFEVMQEATEKINRGRQNIVRKQNNQIQNKLQVTKQIKKQPTLIIQNRISCDTKNIEQVKIKDKTKKYKNSERLKQAQQKLLEIIRVCDEGL